MTAAVIAAVAVFVLSALAAGANLSGYERLKSAGFKFLDESYRENGAYSNGMYWINATLFIDGAEAVYMDRTILRDGDRNFTRNSTYYSQAAINDIFKYSGGYNNSEIQYSDNDVMYRWRDDGTFSESDNYWRRFADSSPRYADDNENFMTQSEKRLIEAVADALIGDTRNYFITDGNTISISLSGNQIPQIAQFAVAALAERVNSDFNLGRGIEDNLKIGTDARFLNGSLTIELDGEDNVTGARFSVELASTVNNKLKSYRFSAEILTRNIGTTVLARPEGNIYGKPVLPSYDEGDAAGVTYQSGAAVA
jgi:hypothetical protein